jgi:hypothetical protein
MLVYLAILAAVATWKFVPRPWHPSITLETQHHLMYSTATRQQTDETAHTLDLLYQAYSNRFGIFRLRKSIPITGCSTNRSTN